MLDSLKRTKPLESLRVIGPRVRLHWNSWFSIPNPDTCMSMELLPCAGKVSYFVFGDFTVEWLCRIAALMANRRPSCEKRIVFLTLLTSWYRWRVSCVASWKVKIYFSLFSFIFLFISLQKHICKKFILPTAPGTTLWLNRRINSDARAKFFHRK